MRETFAVECSSFLASSGHRLGDFVSRMFHKKQPGIPSPHGAAYRRRTIRVRFVFMARHNPASFRGGSVTAYEILNLSYHDVAA